MNQLAGKIQNAHLVLVGVPKVLGEYEERRIT